MVSKDERSIWGPLGRPPDSVLKGSQFIQRQWKELTKDAKHVTTMVWNIYTERKAKEIEERYRSIVRSAEAAKSADRLRDD